jgi:hypothetical protein
MALSVLSHTRIGHFQLKGSNEYLNDNMFCLWNNINLILLWHFLWKNTIISCLQNWPITFKAAGGSLHIWCTSWRSTFWCLHHFVIFIESDLMNSLSNLERERANLIIKLLSLSQALELRITQTHDKNTPHYLFVIANFLICQQTIFIRWRAQNSRNCPYCNWKFLNA